MNVLSFLDGSGIGVVILVAVGGSVAAILLCAALLALLDRMLSTRGRCVGYVRALIRHEGHVATPDQFTSYDSPYPVVVPDLHHAVITVGGLVHTVRTDAETYDALEEGACVDVDFAIGRFSRRMRVLRIAPAHAPTAA